MPGNRSSSRALSSIALSRRPAQKKALIALYKLEVNALAAATGWLTTTQVAGFGALTSGT
jgi:hypothetical protein